MPAPGRHLDQLDAVGAEDLDRPVNDPGLLVASLIVLEWQIFRRSDGVPLEIERDRGRDAVGPIERVVGIGEARRVRLVPDRPLLERSVAHVLGPHRFALDHERIAAHRNLGIEDVQQRTIRSGQRRPVPRGAPDDPMTGEHPEGARGPHVGVTGTPRGEHPLLDPRAGMAEVVLWRSRHDPADYGPCPTTDRPPSSAT